MNIKKTLSKITNAFNDGFYKNKQISQTLTNMYITRITNETFRYQSRSDVISI